jgi:signal transduction histidine kinase
MFHGEAAIQIEEAVRQVRMTKNLCRAEYSIKMPHTDLWYEARLVPFVEDQIIITIRNISEEKQITHLKDKLIETVSHELKTPLTIVKLAVESLHEGHTGNLAPNQMTILDKAASNIAKLESLVDNLIYTSIIESGDTRLIRRPLELDKWINNIVARRSKADKAIKYFQKFPKNLPMIYGDPIMLTHAFTNILENAERYAENKVNISASTFTKSKVRYVRIIVSDDGPGMNSEQKKQLFKRFIQLDREYGAGHKGTGLGLAICKDIIDTHQGNLQIKSDKDKGTQVTITLKEYIREDDVLLALENSLATAKTNESKVAFIYLSIKNMGEIEGTCREEQIHSMITAVKKSLKDKAVRKVDRVFHYSKKDFIIILNNTGLKQTQAMHPRLQALAHESPCLGELGMIYPEFQIRMSLYPDDSTDAEQLFRLLHY